MGKKKVDPRIRTLIENGIKTNHRSMFIIIGDNANEQVVNLHYILSKSVVKKKPNVLWCYKKDLGFSTHRKKRMNQIKKQIQKGLRDPEKEDPFELFVSSTDVRWTYYKESHKILGNTYGMCVLQDFEALTPNLLARTIETVEGGGLIIFLLKSLTSLRQLYHLTMDVHTRFRTDSRQNLVSRFNERFILSLGNCQNCLVLDDSLNILPISSNSAKISPTKETSSSDEKKQELNDLKESLKDTEPVGSIVAETKTVDQARAVLQFVEGISEKTLRSTVALTAPRGRGKSAALGLAIAAAVAFGYSNIFVTSPSPENLKTLFQFIFRGFDRLNYKEHIDYELIESTNPEFNKAIVRVNIFKSHRQTIQYIQPNDFAKLGQAELLVIDEAAAIPLSIVKQMLGPYLVFISSTVNGYEGTGRSLSLKLINQLRQQSGKNGGRVLRELELKESIRYSNSDPIEQWLNELLCLDASSIPRLSSGYPHPTQCDLYYVNRDTLFSYHTASEKFLQKLVGLFVSSHYKNSPDDLLLISDAPGHHVFVLLGPVDINKGSLPEILCAVQVALEGEISRESVVSNLSRGRGASGDLIPWTISQQFQDNDFPSLSGARIVRIATFPEYQKMGYASRALDLLNSYYQGDIPNISEHVLQSESSLSDDPEGENLLTEKIEPRKNLPPLMIKLQDRIPERLHYMGVSYGINQQLFGFWKKNGYIPVYLRQTSNEQTGEHTCIMLRNLKCDDLDISCSPNWLNEYSQDFRRRFLSLLGYSFKIFPSSMALSILHTENPTSPSYVIKTKDDLYREFSPYDIKRLESYSRSLVDYHVIVDLLPAISKNYFLGRMESVSISAGQSAILIGAGLQHKTMDDISENLSLPTNQVLALFNKAMRKFSQFFKSIQESAAEASLPGAKKVILEPINRSLKEELTQNAQEVKEKSKQNLTELLHENELSGHTIGAKEEVELGKAVKSLKSSKNIPSSVSVPATKGESSLNKKRESIVKEKKKSKKAKMKK